MVRGRRPSLRGILSFEDVAKAAPERVVLDTSFVFEALLSSQPLHAHCVEFLTTLAARETVVYFNTLLELELLESAFQLALRERWGNKWRPEGRRYDGRTRRRARRLQSSLMHDWDDLRGSFFWSRVEVEEVMGDVPEIMSSYGLASYDAIHAGTCLVTQVGDLVTLDTSFANLPMGLFTLHTDPSKVSRCRQIRLSKK